MTDNHVTRPQVLIVDADPESAGVLTGLLRDEYEISVTVSGETALQIARSDKPPDLPVSCRQPSTMMPPRSPSISLK